MLVTSLLMINTMQYIFNNNITCYITIEVDYMTQQLCNYASLFYVDVILAINVKIYAL